MAGINFEIQDPVGLISLKEFKFGDDESLLEQITIKEINMSESLLTPGLQTSVVVQSFIYTVPPKWWEKIKAKQVSFTLERTKGNAEDPSTAPIGNKISVNQLVYRMENRQMIPTNVAPNEEFAVHACDQSLIADAQHLVSKSWKCTKPSEIVKGVLKNCLKVDDQRIKVEDADPARDYIAENIHPFQVIAQQSNVALYKGDPSFQHYMTYAPYDDIDSEQAKPTHYFTSIKKLTEKDRPVQTYYYGETGLYLPRDRGTGQGKVTGGYQNKTTIIAMMFPCDFDYLADTLNGIDENGQDKNTLTTFNPTQKSASQTGNQDKGCGMGGYNYKTALTNYGSAEAQNSCNMDVENHLLKRQGRLALLERDKIALRITVPWDPGLHVGHVIEVIWQNKDLNSLVYGSGSYLVLHLHHTIRMGGLSTTTMDCVSKSVGQGQT